MFSKEGKGKGDSDISATDAQDSQEQVLDKEFQKYLAKDLVSIDDTVWHENFTWNLILRFYGWWQNRKIKIR